MKNFSSKSHYMQSIDSKFNFANATITVPNGPTPISSANKNVNFSLGMMLQLHLFSSLCSKFISKKSKGLFGTTKEETKPNRTSSMWTNKHGPYGRHIIWKMYITHKEMNTETHLNRVRCPHMKCQFQLLISIYPRWYDTTTMPMIKTHVLRTIQRYCSLKLFFLNQTLDFEILAHLILGCIWRGTPFLLSKLQCILMTLEFKNPT